MATSAFFAVLRDATKLAAAAADDLAAQSVKLTAAADDIVTLTGKAAVKTAGVAGDDLAVGAGQISGVSPSRELPALWRITKGSLLNKALLSVVLLVVSVYAPVLITVALVLGALYLAFEGAEGLLEHILPHAQGGQSEGQALSEDDKVKGAIRTDFILSLEILVISLAAAGDVPLAHKAMVLGLVSILMTVAVYGLIGLIIRLDDMGLHLAKSGSESKKKIGMKLANAAPVILKALEPIGMVAMFMVAGGILTHLVHLSVSNMIGALALDIVVGVTVGLALAGVLHLAHKVRGK